MSFLFTGRLIENRSRLLFRETVKFSCQWGFYKKWIIRFYFQPLEVTRVFWQSDVFIVFGWLCVCVYSLTYGCFCSEGNPGLVWPCSQWQWMLYESLQYLCSSITPHILHHSSALSGKCPIDCLCSHFGRRSLVIPWTFSPFLSLDSQSMFPAMQCSFFCHCYLSLLLRVSRPCGSCDTCGATSCFFTCQ